MKKVARTHNSTYPKGGGSCSKDSFVVNQTFVFQIKFCGKSPALRVAAKGSCAIWQICAKIILLINHYNLVNIHNPSPICQTAQALER